MFFLALEEGDSYLEEVSPVTKQLLKKIQKDLKER